MLKGVIAKVKKVFGNPAYNFIIHTSPINSEGQGVDSYHWHLEFMPKLTRVAGFEWGTGFYLVQTPPELAAKFLREA
jgi:UDPglucose--hexose-1-phosphate uridylyltransferase